MHSSCLVLYRLAAMHAQSAQRMEEATFDWLARCLEGMKRRLRTPSIPPPHSSQPQRPQRPIGSSGRPNASGHTSQVRFNPAWLRLYGHKVKVLLLHGRCW